MGKRRLMISDEEEEYEDVRKETASPGGSGLGESGRGGKVVAAVAEDEDEEQGQEVPRPVGEAVRVSWSGETKRTHYRSFEHEGIQYELEDSVLLLPEDPEEQKPPIATIKDITQDSNGRMFITGQWFYRPEEAERRSGGTFQRTDARELYYSFHLDEYPAKSVMHKCVVHFIPLNKHLPVRAKNPGFIVQKVYDTSNKSLFDLEDKDYHDDKWPEIDLLVQRTREHIGELFDIEKDETKHHQEENSNTKQQACRKYMLQPIDASRNDDITIKSEYVETNHPGSCIGGMSVYHTILASHRSLTGVSHRDKVLEKLLQGVEPTCCKGSLPLDNLTSGNKADKRFSWPEDALSAVTSLEKEANDSLGADFLKYNQKMRTLVFNLKNNPQLARRFLNKELEPSVILNMSPVELKDGLTSEERNIEEPKWSEHMQMTSARCKRCDEKKVAVTDVIQAGGSGYRYQLECISCGSQWYAFPDDFSSLTIDLPVAGSVETASLATPKFEDARKLVNTRESVKPSPGIIQKKAAPHVPKMESQSSSLGQGGRISCCPP